MKILLIAGWNGAGKTTLASKLPGTRLPLDMYYRNAEDPLLPQRGGLPDWENPDSLHLDEVVRDLITLLTDGQVDVPVYSYAQDRRVGVTRLAVDSMPIIAEGLLVPSLEERLPSELPGNGAVVRVLVRNPIPVTVLRGVRRDLADGRRSLRASLGAAWRNGIPMREYERRCEQWADVSGGAEGLVEKLRQLCAASPN